MFIYNVQKLLTSSEENIIMSGRFCIPLDLTSGKALYLAATNAYNIDMLPPGLKIPSPSGIPNNFRICFMILISTSVNTGATSNVYL